MNCKQAEELLPLYAGRELEKKRSTLVAEHLQLCAACARVADEYRESIQLTRTFAPPTFNEAFYAGVRQRVLREIESESKRPAWSQTIVSLFQLRLSWAIATMLLILVSMVAIYFLVNRGNEGPQVVDAPPENVQPAPRKESNSQPQLEQRAALPASVNAGGNHQRAGISPQQKRSRNTLFAQMNTVKTKSRDPVSTAINGSSTVNRLPLPIVFPKRSADLGRTLRVEIQTKDPNIRIIWFAQQEPKPAVPSSKGI